MAGVLFEQGDSADFQLAARWSERLLERDSNYSHALLKVRTLARTASPEATMAYIDQLIRIAPAGQHNAIRNTSASIIWSYLPDSTSLRYAHQLLSECLENDTNYVYLREQLLVGSALGYCDALRAGIPEVERRSEASLGRVSAYTAGRLALACLNCARQDPSFAPVGLRLARHATELAPENYPYWTTYARLAVVSNAPDAASILQRAISLGREYEQPTEALERLGGF